ncbi:hypothetical protein COV86_04440 [Candidatus Roizmanbacteria bacterium CG11_big_fil_rev_8_21_14_0_20_35_14]|uniref:DUF488 domain-containing protein n=1 Tax=Candidatus Roizmanbacteria bacterium CG11_big_fil_rev_8_21_14_0_20_35_14 TaxID=1974855 RepID=A0A2H0KLN9_9BACT|nr:MAG: hypothetical protein COV86_04440 [Candidatus Roizmanbacteria bacterium CG11_big_fil_rev_8_21_14_0_20_35_14]
MKKLFLTGYEKETIEEFLDKLKKENITTVIDIRETPLSRKNGFSKNLLSKLLEKKGINYFHFQDLGSPKELRDKLKKDLNYLNFFKNYREYIHHQPNLIKKVLKTIYSNGRSVLLCFEKEHELCHRSIVASELLKCDPNLQVIPM